MISIYMEGNNEIDRVASPESAPIHLKRSKYAVIKLDLQ